MKKADTTGAWGERLAAAMLRKQGYKIVATNWSCRFGEIDVIAENREFLVFAEVKLRKDASHGAAREFVGSAKQERLRSTAQLYLCEYPTEKQPRFDVVEIYAPEGAQSQKPMITHLEDAF